MFYERYLELCKKAGLSPSAAAAKAKFNKGTVSVWKKKYEDGKDVVPDQETIDKICGCFGCTENWLRNIPDRYILARSEDDEYFAEEKPATEKGDGLTEEERKFIEWYRSQASEKDKAIVRMIVEGEK